MTCTQHPGLRGDYRCPCNPPQGTQGTVPFLRVNAITDPDGELWLQTLHNQWWFPAMAPTGAWDFVEAGEPYPPASPAS